MSLQRFLVICCLASAFALGLPQATAEAPHEAVDFRVTLTKGEAPLYEGPAGLVELVEREDGERYAWRVNLSRNYTVGEFLVRTDAFDIERPRQILPTLTVPHDEFPLFTWIPRPVWDVDGVPRYGLYNNTEHGVFHVIHLGLPGPHEGGPSAPFDGILALERDVTPPGVAPGPVQNLTYRDFYQEATTSELALVDLVVCCDPSGEEVHNPTTTYHVLHKFPIQGLDPQKDYTLRMVATDWSGNSREGADYSITTPAKPDVPEPRITPLSPAPDARVAAGPVVVEARIESPDSPIDGGDIRFFLDKREVRENLEYVDGVFRWRSTTPLSPGTHAASVEVMNAAGGTSRAAWTFEVEKANTPAPGAWVAIAIAAFALALRRRD